MSVCARPSVQLRVGAPRLRRLLRVVREKEEEEEEGTEEEEEKEEEAHVCARVGERVVCHG